MLPRRLAVTTLVVVLFLLTSFHAAAPRAQQLGPSVTEDPPSAEAVDVATFAGGCFWCLEPPFDKLDGVISTTSGYTGGRTKNPTYEQVSSGAPVTSNRYRSSLIPRWSALNSC